MVILMFNVHFSSFMNRFKLVPVTLLKGSGPVAKAPGWMFRSPVRNGL